MPETRQQPEGGFLKSLFLHVIVLRNGHSGENAEDDQDGNDFNEREALLSPVLSHRIPPSTNVEKRLKPERKNHMYEARDRIFFIYRVPRDSSKGLRYPRKRYSQNILAVS